MFENNDSLNISLSSFEDNDNEFIPFHHFSLKENIFYEDTIFSNYFFPDFVNSFLENSQKINFLAKDNSKNLNNIEKNNTDETPVQYTFEKIQAIIKNLDLSNNIKKIIVKDSNLTRIDKEMSGKVLIGKKKGRKKKKNLFFETNKQKKIGRKTINDYKKRKHDRNCGDNIIKKIKIKFIEYSLKFLNNVLKGNVVEEKLKEYKTFLKRNKRYYYGDELENSIKNLDYKFLDKIKKEKELSLLKKPLKELFSNKISPKYSTLPSDYNKKLIETILNNEKNNLIIMFAFNLTFEEWIDIFTYKRNFESFENFDKDKMEGINNKFDKVEKLILEIYEKKINHNYLSYFISYTFNYKRWFLLKNGRNRISKKINDK